MTSPFAVIANPSDNTHHLLFFLAGTTQQLAFEVRPPVHVQEWNKYTPNNVPKGNVANPTALAVTTLDGVVTVYGLAGVTASSTQAVTNYVSTLSPVLNPISTDASAIPATTSLAACANPTGTANYVYYISTTDNIYYHIREFLVDGATTVANAAWTKSVPSLNTQLAAVTFNATGDRFVMYANTDGNIDYGLYYIGSKDTTRKCCHRIIFLMTLRTGADEFLLIAQLIDGSSGVRNASPLAVASFHRSDDSGHYLDVFLYYVDNNHALFRSAGRVRGGSMQWFECLQSNGPKVDQSSLITATTDGTTNYIYYLRKDATTSRGPPFAETIESTWFNKT